MNHVYTLDAGISPVAVHNKGNVARDGACFEYANDSIDGFVAKPESILQKRHHWGAIDWVRADGTFKAPYGNEFLGLYLDFELGFELRRLEF